MRQVRFLGVWGLLLLVVVAQGCSSSKKKDTAPDPFTLADVTNVALSAEFESNPITVAGISAAAAIRVTGASGAQYSINGGAFTSTQGQVNKGDRVVVKVTSSAEFSTQLNVTLNIGGVSDVFTVTTLPQDITPEAFSFAAKTDVGFDAWQESTPFTVTGLNTAAAISITNGEYKVGDGEFTSVTGTVSEGDTVIVRLKSAIKAATQTTATLTVGTVNSAFVATTGPDTVAPEVEILFPPPYTMTEGDSVFIRGKAKDVNGELSSVQINGTAATLGAVDAEGFTPWSATVSLTQAENTLTVTALDVAENPNASESVKVRMDAESGAFPDNENPTATVAYSGDFGLIDGRHVYLVPDTWGNKIIAVDMQLGKRSVILDGSLEPNINLDRPQYLIWVGDSIYFSDDKTVYYLSISSGEISDMALQVENSFFNKPRGLAQFNLNGEKFLFIADGRSVIKHNLTNPDQIVLTDGSLESPGQNMDTLFDGNLWTFGRNLYSENNLLVNTNHQIYLVNVFDGTRAKMGGSFDAEYVSDMSDFNSEKIFTINSSPTTPSVSEYSVASNERTLLSSNELPGSTNMLVEPFGIDCVDDESYCLIVDPGLNAIVAMDIESGYRVVFTKSAVE